MTIEMLGDRKERFGGWSRRCCYDGREYQVSVERGKRVRIPYKPRGAGAYGFKWNGAVYANGRCIWTGQVPGSIGVRGLLIEAGVFPSLDK